MEKNRNLTLEPPCCLRTDSVRCKFVECNSVLFFFFFSCGAATHRGSWPPHSRGFLDHTQRRPQSVRLLWTSDQLVAETSNWQHTTLTTNIHAPGGIWTHDLSRRAATYLRLRPRGHCDRLNSVLTVAIFIIINVLVQKIFHTKCISMFLVFLRTECNKPKEVVL